MRFEELFQDLGLAWRSLRKDPGFSTVVVLTLALGIAANATIFSLMNPYLFRPLPFRDAERLLQLEQVHPIAEYERDRLSLPQFADWRQRSRAFEDMAAYYYGVRNVTGPEGPERIGTAFLTANLFDLLGAEAALGRTFAAGEDGPAGADVVVLSHGLWQRRYGGTNEILGRSITLDGNPHTVIGIMPPRFNFPFGSIKMWTPIREDPAREGREENYFLVVGRLRNGVTAETARTELQAIQRELGSLYPKADGKFSGVVVRPLREALNFAWGVLRTTFTVLLAAVAAVLAIACVNVASLTLARSSGRAREVAVRSALGAGRSRLLSHFLTESFVLAGVGGALGIALTVASARLIGPLLPEDLYRIGEVSVDGRVLFFTLLITLATPFLFGMAPALKAAAASPGSALKQGAGSGLARGSLRSRRALVVLEVALAIVLISGAGLMIRSLLELQQVDLGLNAERLLTAEIQLPESDYAQSEQIEAYFDRATASLSALPGLRRAATLTPLPLNHETWLVSFTPPGGDPVEDWPTAVRLRASPAAFETMGIPLLAGRTFTAEDRARDADAVIIGRELAERYWPGESPVGRSFTYGSPESPQVATIVGVVGEIKHEGIVAAARSQVYFPLTDGLARRRFVVMEAEGNPVSLIPAVRKALLALDSDLPVGLRQMSEIVLENTLQWSLPSAFLALFGAVALLLAALGIYGVVAYSVAQRRREMGIRVALGASGPEIRQLVVGEGVRLTGIGLALGLAAALAAAQVMSSVLFEVSPFDPATFGAVLLLFLAVAAGASAVPALRAARVSPQVVLRQD